MSGFEPLRQALDGWFEADLASLPDDLRERVGQDLFPLAWEQLTPDQRRSAAAQFDQQHDPALEGERQRAWDRVIELSDLRRQIERWEQVAAPAARDLEIKDATLAELRHTLAKLEARFRDRDRAGPVSPSNAPRDDSPAAQRRRYLPYPAALAKLRSRWSATPEELAAWIYCGPDAGGLAAYVHANELEPPPPFRFATGNPTELGADHEFVAPMMVCWFVADDIEGFQPVERFMLGRDLIARWSKFAGVDPAAFIRAKLMESRLDEAHPIYGGTRATFPDEQNFPPMELGLYMLSDVETIEAEDFGMPAAPIGGQESAEARRDRVRRRVDALRGAGARAFLKTVAAEEGVSVARIKQLIGEPKEGRLPRPPASWIPSSPPASKASPTRRKS